jgi:hypothetical protein
VRTNFHIVLPKEDYEFLKRANVIGADNQIDVNLVFVHPTTLDEMHVTIADARSTTPYMHILTLWGKITRKDTKKSAM